jgi:DNA-binding winged helix-turn-helix (wHTH) protein/tetratricopeptide (TPR) repeat protein
MADPSTPPPRRRFGVFEVHPESGELRKQGRKIRLAEQSFQVLMALVERPGELVTREQLRRRLWPGEVFVEFDANLNTAVSLLRDALGDSAKSPRFIETLPRRGYRFLADVAVVRDEPVPRPEPASPPPRQRAWVLTRRPAIAGACVAVVTLAGLSYRYAAVPAESVVSIVVPVARRVDPRAHEAYLKGRHALRSEVEERLGMSVGFFEEAIRIDPGYAPAYAGLAEYYRFTDALPPGQALPMAREYALKALELDGRLASPHLSLALVSMWGDWDWVAAEREFQRSVELDPDDATTRRWYSLFLDLIGRPQAAWAQLERARQLDPVSALTHHAVGFHYFTARRYADSLEQFRQVEELNPHDPKVIEGLGTVYHFTGDHQKALAVARRGVELWGRDAALIGALAIAHARVGDEKQARALLKEVQGLARTRHIPPTWFAMIYMNLGDIDRAFEWLDRAVAARDGYALQLKVSPLYDPLRSDPRFAELLQRIRLP